MKKLRDFMKKKERKVEPTREEKVVVIPHDYGLDVMEIALRSRDFGWRPSEEPKKQVFLVNVSECKDKISVMGLVSAWRNTGHSEWEYLLAGLFVMAVKEAVEKEKTEKTKTESEDEEDEEEFDGTADISIMFNRDLLASGDRVFTAKQVWDHLIDWFTIVDQVDNKYFLRLRVR